MGVRTLGVRHRRSRWALAKNPPLTAERKPQVVEKQTLAALFVSWKLHGKCTGFFTDLQKIPIWGGSNGFLPHFHRCWMSGFSPLFTAVLTAVYSGWSIPFFCSRAILTDRKCTDLHSDICEKIHNNRVVLDFYLNLWRWEINNIFCESVFVILDRKLAVSRGKGWRDTSHSCIDYVVSHLHRDGCFISIRVWSIFIGLT